jgi:predicted alpha/beta superfamily hydrolase
MNDGECGTGGTCVGGLEAIVIGIENTPDRIAEYTPVADPQNGGGGNGDAYLAMIVTELKPRVDSMLRTLPDRAHTAILGSSLGGLISAYAGVKQSDTFGLIGAMSPSTFWDNGYIVGAVTNAPKQPRPLRVYLDSGDSGTSNDDVGDTNKLAAAYLATGYVEGMDFHHVVAPGDQHNEVYWARRLPGALAFLLTPRR